MTGESDEAAPTVVSGSISFEDGHSPFASATIYVQLEDVSVADGPSVVLSQQVLHGVAPPEPGRAVAFRVSAGTLDPRRRYNLRVHVDLDGDGTVSSGGFVTVQRYPVVPGRETGLAVVVRGI